MHSQIDIQNSLGVRAASEETLQRCMDRKDIFQCLIPLFEYSGQRLLDVRKKKLKRGKQKKKLKEKQQQRQKKQKRISNWKQQTTLNCQLKEAVRLLGYNNDIQKLTIQQTATDISDREQPSLTLSKFFPVCRWDETTSCPTYFYKVSDQCRNWATAHRPLP